MSAVRPHTVTVVPMIRTRNKYGTYDLTRGEPIVKEEVSVQPFGGGTYGNLETDSTINDQWTVRGSLPWPGGVKSIIIWEGVEYDQVGLPKEHTIGVGTQHFQVRMSRRGAEVK